ncbi:MAG: YidC/Oxa1 family membrane protein insertase [Actinomycetota bacterium]|nr:YidC/Oxa1 family membrane protein insertase [Actinomycetota bacterium]
MIALKLFEYPASLLAWFYSLTHDYILSISMIAMVVMLLTAPLVLKSTKGMLEMQRLQPEMRKLQNQYRGDRQKLNEEMMKLYQEHKVNPLASCLPLLLQMPVFIIMFQVLRGLTNRAADGTFAPQYLGKGTELFTSLDHKREMLSWGLDLSKRPYGMFSESFGKGLIYALLVVLLGVMYFAQQRMVASRAAVSPSVSPMQQKLMQYLPVVFAVFMGFYLTGLVIYYMAQAVFRIGLNYYITHRFYKGHESLGRQAQRAGEAARELAKKDGGGGGMFANAKRDLAAAKEQQKPATGTTSKRVTPPKNKPTPPSGRTTGKPAPTGKAARPSGATRPPKKK